MDFGMMANELGYVVSIYVKFFLDLHMDFFILFIFMLFTIVRTPVMVWWKSMIFGDPIAVLIEKTNRIRFKTGKYKAENLKVKKRGIYEMNPVGSYRLDGGVVGGLYVSDKSPPVSPEFLTSSQHLINKGFENYSEAELSAELGRTGLGEIIENIGSGKQDYDELPDGMKIKISKVTNNPHFQAVMENHLYKRMTGEDNYLYLDFSKIRNFFKYSGTPQSIQKIVDEERANAIEENRQGFILKPDHIMGFIMIIIGAAIAWFIFNSAGTQAITETAKQVVGSVAGVSKSAGGIGVQ